MLMLARDKIKTYRMEVIHCTVLKLTDNRHQLANLMQLSQKEAPSKADQHQPQPEVRHNSESTPVV